MFRWNNVNQKTIDGMTLKMYREPYEAEETQRVPFENKELDHYALKHLGSEVFMYKILDTNFIALMEERFDVDRFKQVYVPVKETL